MKRIQTGKKGKTLFIHFCTFYLLLLSLLSCGCNNKFFEPRQIGRFRPTPAVNVILDTLGVAEESSAEYEGGEEPRPEDCRAVEVDYVFGPGDIVRISIHELFQEGQTVADNYIVTETGKISIPDVGVIQAVGATEIQLEEEIKQILSPSILKSPSVTVTLLGSEWRTFSILGDGIPEPGRYVIPRYDFRLADALAMAGGPRQFNVSYIYVTRRPQYIDAMAGPMNFEIIEPGMIEIEKESTGPKWNQPELIEPEEMVEPEKDWLEVITPLAQNQWPESKVVIASAELATDRDVIDIVWPEKVKQTRSNERRWDENRQMPEQSLGITDSERTDNPVSIQDILKTLSERARKERVGERERMVGVDDKQELFAEPSMPGALDEPIDIEEALKSFGRPAAPETIEEPMDFTIDETTGPTFEPMVPDIEEKMDEGEGGRIEWIFQDGKWVPVQVGPPVQPRLPKPDVEFEPREEAGRISTELVAPGYEWAKKTQGRLIKIPVDKLLVGDPRYNIVIKPGDNIHIPVDVIGEFCILGNTNYQGFINMTGRPLTLKMAIAAAGGLDEYAWPKKCEVVRRIGENKEEVVMVDLDKIASGEQPDFFIKPNDLINVGTHYSSVWRAVLRNSFRAAYGFGFIYDRNFADADFGKGFKMTGKGLF